MQQSENPPGHELADDELVARILAGETGLFEVIVRRYNRRLYRVIRAVVQSDEETEELVQDTYVRAYTHLQQFAGRALFSTWITKIGLHEAWKHMKQQHKQEAIDSPSARSRQINFDNPERQLQRAEARTLLEVAMDALPEMYRSVLVMRSLEEMSTTETATCLEISEDAVKVRLLRARKLLRREIYHRTKDAAPDAFLILGERCNRVTANVLARVSGLPEPAAARDSD